MYAHSFRLLGLFSYHVRTYIFGWQFLNELNFQILSLSFLKTSSIKFFTFFLQTHCKSIVYLFGWEKLIWGREVSFIHIENTSFQSEYFPPFLKVFCLSVLAFCQVLKKCSQFHQQTPFSKECCFHRKLLYLLIFYKVKKTCILGINLWNVLWNLENKI